MGKYRGGAVPKAVNHDYMKAVLEYHGWTCETGGKHVTKMVKSGERPITIPRHKNRDFGRDLRAQLLRQANLTQLEGGEDSG